MNDSPDTPGARLVTILACDPNPGRVDRARMGRHNPADTGRGPRCRLRTCLSDFNLRRHELALG